LVGRGGKAPDGRPVERVDRPERSAKESL
jgi:hypothetical protein